MLIDADAAATAIATADATADAAAAAAAAADATVDATADANALPPPCAGTKRAASSVSGLELPATSRARTEEAAEAEAVEAAEMQVDEEAGLEAIDMPRPGTHQPTVVPAMMPRPGTTHPTTQTPQGHRLQRVVQTYTVSVPAGVGPGEQFQAYLGGELADVIVPHGARPCATLHVQMPRSVHKYAVS
eukprot:scaffold49247_cov61-Phaeocystis_antarctica.AAC.6